LRFDDKEENHWIGFSASWFPCFCGGSVDGFHQCPSIHNSHIFRLSRLESVLQLSPIIETCVWFVYDENALNITVGLAIALSLAFAILVGAICLLARGSGQYSRCFPRPPQSRTKNRDSGFRRLYEIPSRAQSRHNAAHHLHSRLDASIEEPNISGLENCDKTSLNKTCVNCSYCCISRVSNPLPYISSKFMAPVQTVFEHWRRCSERHMTAW